MAMDLKNIKNIIIVMMENRSFDNLLGYISLNPKNTPVDGLQSSDEWKKKQINPYNGVGYPLYPLEDPYTKIDADPPHERDNIAKQMGTPKKGIYPMNGFVANYADAVSPITPEISSAHLPPVMGYFTEKEAPVTDFFYRNFTIFDHWFSALPAGTQPNRLMALNGESCIDINHTPIPSQKLVYDWLNERGVSWKVYHEGMPFIALMPEWIPNILCEKNFCPLDQLYKDIQDDNCPQVIFIEPTYTDSPKIGASSDDHSPSSIRGGQEFLHRIYRTITEDTDFWKNLVMIVTYDEHGGFFDHVSPPIIKTLPPKDADYPSFESLGVRVPAFLISPFADTNKVCTEIMDHTSILKFIAQRFGDGSYSETVDGRPVGNIADFLRMPDNPDTNPPSIDSLKFYEDRAKLPLTGLLPGGKPDSKMQEAFHYALQKIKEDGNAKSSFFSDLISAFKL